jgi:hypothetical protein
VLLAVAFCALSLVQVLEDPIAGPVTSALVAVVSTVPLAFRSVRPVVAAVVGTAIWLVPTPQGYLLLGYVAAALLWPAARRGRRGDRCRRDAFGAGAGRPTGRAVRPLSAAPHPADRPA